MKENYYELEEPPEHLDLSDDYILDEDFDDEDSIDQNDCFCGDCPSFDELNCTCWSFYGRFGESVSTEDIVCEFGFKRYFDPKTKVIW